MSAFEYLADMSKSDKQALFSRLLVILEHMMKMNHLPALRQRNQRLWCQTIETQRRDLIELLKKNPALKRELTAIDISVFCNRAGRRLAQDYPAIQLPTTCPYTLEDVIGPDIPTA